MAAPWLKYQAADNVPAVEPGAPAAPVAAPPAAGPWAKYQTAQPVAAPSAPPPAADPPPAAEQPGFFGRIRDAGQAVLSAASSVPAALAGTVGGVAGNVAEVAGADPGTSQRWRENATSALQVPYPESMVAPYAAEAEGALGRGAAKLEEALPGAGNVLTAAGDAANLVGLGGAGSAIANTVRNNLAKRTANAASSAAVGARTPEELVKAGGFRVRPHDIERAGGTAGVVDRALQTVGGPSDLKRADILHNLDRTRALALEDLGLNDLSDASIAQAKAPHAAVYDQIDQLPQVMFDDQLKSAILNAGQSPNTMLPIPQEVSQLRAALLGHEGATGAQLRTTIGDLRAKAKDNLARGEGEQVAPKNRELGTAQVDLAHALEDMLGRSLSPDLAARFPEARRGFAKIGAVERARVGDRIDPRALMSEAQTNRGVDGNLRIIADLAEQYPEVFNIIVPQPQDSALGSMIARGAAAGLGGTVGGVPGAVAGVAAAEATPMLARKILNRGAVPKGPMSERAPSYFRGPPDFGPTGPPAPSPDDLLAAQVRQGASGDSLTFADQMLADDATQSANHAPLDDPFLRAPDPVVQPGTVPTDTPVRGAGSFADLMSELQGSAEAPAPLASLADLLSVGGGPGKDLGGLSLADVLGADDLGVAREPFRPAPGDVVRSDRNMAPREITAGSTTGELTPTDIFEGGAPFADVLDQGGLGLQREAFRPDGADVLPFRQGEASAQPELSLADYQPGREAMDPSGTLADHLAGDLELSPTPRGAPAELSLADDGGFQRSFADEMTDAPQQLKAAKPKKEAGSSQRIENVQDQIVKDRHIEKGSTVFLRGSRKNPKAYIAVTPEKNAVRITSAWVDEAARGNGIGQQQLLDAVDYASEKGLPLTSDKTVTAAQLRVYESLKKKGELEFEYADPEAVKKALSGEGDTVVKAKGGPVITNIRRPAVDTGGLSLADELAL